MANRNPTPGKSVSLKRYYDQTGGQGESPGFSPAKIQQGSPFQTQAAQSQDSYDAEADEAARKAAADKKRAEQIGNLANYGQLAYEGYGALAGGSAATTAATAGTAGTATTAAGAGSAAGASLGSAGNAAGAAAGGATAGSIAATGGTLAALYAAYAGYKSYQKHDKMARGGNFTEDEVYKTVQPGSMKWGKRILGEKLNKALLDTMPHVQLGKMILGSGKGTNQILRDRTRYDLKDTGVIDDNYLLTLRNGATFDFGKDGGARLVDAAGNERRYMDPDAAFDRIADVTAMGTALGYVASLGQDRKQTAQDIGGYMTNALTTGATNYDESIENARIIAEKMGVTKSSIPQLLDVMEQQGKINAEERTVFADKLSQIAVDDTQPEEVVQENTGPRQEEAPQEEKKKKRRKNYTPYQFGEAPGAAAAKTQSDEINNYINMIQMMGRQNG